MVAFSDVINLTGIVQQVADLTNLDSIQWSSKKIANSCNNWLDKITGFAIGNDTRFNWDDSNHTKLPIGTTDLIANQSEYSFLVDEQGNKIVTLLRIDVKDSNGNWTKLTPIDQNEIVMALDEFEKTAGIPMYYDKTADNVIKLYPKPASSVTAGLKFYFQRTPSYFVYTDTTKEPGVSPLLHRGFVIASAYDAALSKGLPNMAVLAAELLKEEQKIKQYFGDRNNDEKSKIKAKVTDCR